MKNKYFATTLSCVVKCIGYRVRVINKKLIFVLLGLIFLTSCGTPTAMLGPAYTLTSSGNVVQAGMSYGSNEMITMYTGKTPIENIKKISSLEKDNIQKLTLEGEEFYNLINKRVKKTHSILNLSNQ